MEPKAPPRLSPDGKFYWDGSEWKPYPGASAPAAPSEVKVKGVVRTAPARWRYWFWTILIGGILLFIVWAFFSAPK
ncbi:MAG TPA: hypothetical protein VF160_02825 [Candidatus Dormibacteraeota bacterium]